MKIIEARGGIEVLSRLECLALLSDDVIGRLAIVVGDAPMIMPVNYVMDGTAVVFRTDPGMKLSWGPRAQACFEVDAFDRSTCTGWSVVAAGMLEEITPYSASTYDRLRQLPVTPWAAGPKDHWMRLVPTLITGRRISEPRAVLERPSQQEAVGYR